MTNNAARLKAEAGGAEPAFPAELMSDRPDLVLTQTRLFEARRAALEARRSAAEQVVRQRRADLAGLEVQIVQLQASLDVILEQEAAIATLADKGYFPKLRYLSIKRQVADARGEVAKTREAINSARAALAEAIDRRDGLERDTTAETLDRLIVARTERDRTYRSLQQQRTRLRNLIMRAPVPGVVQNLKATNFGQAIRPGDPIMIIVPTGDTLIVDAQVSNNDIGFISLGQSATVKIVTYDYIKYGYLDGVVEHVAPDAVEDPQTGELRFSVLVRTDRTYLGNEPGSLPVHPGMIAEVDLAIGSRSILSYLTDRVVRTASTAFKER